jgi:membrane protein DedA with SNARE-associated domain
MITALISWLASIVVGVISFTGYTGLFFLMFLESCGIPAPSEVIMPFAGFLVFSGRFSFWLVVLIGALGNLFGSLLAYWIGYAGGRPLIEKFGKYIFISHQDLDKAHNWFVNYGELTVFLGRLLPVVRTYISFPAGIAKMDLKKFSFYTFIGALPWCWLFAWLGVKMGANWEMIREKLHYFDLSIAVLVVIFVVWFFGHHARRWQARRKEAN